MSANNGLLERARQDVGLSVADLWFRYFALGGMDSALEVEAVLYGALATTDHNHDLIAAALNERYFELGRDHPVRYASDVIDDDEQPAT